MYARACDFPFRTHGKRPYFSGSAAASQFKDFKDLNLFLEAFQSFQFFFSKFNNFPGFLKTVKTLFKRKGSTFVLLKIPGRSDNTINSRPLIFGFSVYRYVFTCTELIIKTDLTSKFSRSLMI